MKYVKQDKVYEKRIAGSFGHMGYANRYGYFKSGELFIEKPDIVSDLLYEAWYTFTLWLRFKLHLISLKGEE